MVGHPKTHRLIFKSILTFCIVSVLLASAIFAYTLLYLHVVPQIGLIRSVPLVPLQVGEAPKAMVLLDIPGGNPGILLLHQPYDVWMELVVPASPSNLALAQFGVHAQLLNRNHTCLYSTLRPGSLMYRSPWAQFCTELMFFFPVTLLGYSPEIQRLSIPLFDSVTSPAPSWTGDNAPQETTARAYREMLAEWNPQEFPNVTSRHLAFASIQLTAPIHVHQAYLHVEAQLHGLSYWMYHWFFTGMTLGIGVILGWEIMVGSLLYHLLVGSNPDSWATDLSSRPTSPKKKKSTLLVYQRKLSEEGMNLSVSESIPTESVPSESMSSEDSIQSSDAENDEDEIMTVVSTTSSDTSVETMRSSRSMKRNPARNRAWSWHPSHRDQGSNETLLPPNKWNTFGQSFSTSRMTHSIRHRGTRKHDTFG